MHLSVVRWHISTSSRFAPTLIDPIASRHVVASCVRQPRRCQTSQVRYLSRRHVLSRSSAFTAITVTVLHSHTPHLFHHHFPSQHLEGTEDGHPSDLPGHHKDTSLTWYPSYPCLSSALPPSVLACLAVAALAIRRSSIQTPSVHAYPLPARLVLVQECFRQCVWLQTKNVSPSLSSASGWQW